MDLPKLIHVFLQVITCFVIWMRRSCHMHFPPFANKTKLKFDQDFKDCCFSLKLRCRLSQSTQCLGSVVPMATFKNKVPVFVLYKWELVPETVELDLQKVSIEKLDLHMTTLQYQLVLVKNTLCICYNINLCSQPCKAPAFSLKLCKTRDFPSLRHFPRYIARFSEKPPNTCSLSQRRDSTFLRFFCLGLRFLLKIFLNI